ncbi:Trk system potassium transporter TrkA [Aerococcaceae bacterium zg-ZJ1578]|uniref:Trk system potassium transporter TrkA n=1 Tax=Aerococcaceae bacterium zg-252 TaxID=2796928 RepID=UPI001A356BAD|nr:Trk system potassium transporter TrkA [Aerococcaceae bacterium zg-1578]
MKIVIVGGGKVGEKLCAELSHEHNDILLIEKDEEKLDQLMNKFDITGIVGNGASIEIQQEIGVDTADVFIAVTEMDEINLISSVLAKNLGATYTVARVRNPEYSNHQSVLKESLGLSLIINPELSAARDIVRVLKYPSALSAESFAADRVNLVEVEINEDSKLVGVDLREFRQKFGSILVCMSIRNNEAIIPSGNYQIQANDRIFITGEATDMMHFFKVIGNNEKSIRSTLIIGGGRIAYYVLKALKQSKIKATVIELDRERAQYLSEEFPNATIIHADGSDHEILEEYGLEDFDSFMSLTGVDEENLVMSVFAKHNGVKKVITKMSRVEILKILTSVPLRTIITPKQIVANEIIQFVRARANIQGSNVEALYRLADNQVEVLQFRVTRNSKVCNIPLFQLKIKPNVLIAYIMRGQELIFPNGNDQLLPHDRVLVVTTARMFEDLEDILMQ